MNHKQNDTPRLDDIDKQLLNDFQQDFPLCSRPYAEVAEKVGISEQATIDRYNKYHDKGYISRIGATFRCNTIGVSTLAAMSVPEQQIDKTAQLINEFPEVNHNYEREHEYNLWFVVAAENEESLDTVLDRIEQSTGYPILKLPMLEAYHINLGFDLQWT